MRIPEHYLNQLRQAGLLISEPFGSDHAAYPDGYIIGKPQSAGGNQRAGHLSYWGDELIVLDAPVIYLHADDGVWFVAVAEMIPGPGPGDFVHRHQSPEAAIQDILDYFFADSNRIC